MSEFPNFIGIGVQRGGTTWLDKHLRSHPNIYLPPRKELHYFSRDTRFPSPSHLAVTDLQTRLSSNSALMKKWRKDAARLARNTHEGADIFKARWNFNYTFGHYDDAWYKSLFDDGKKFGVRGEITPAYTLLDDQAVTHMRSLMPRLKVILMLRDPIYRDWSQYRYSLRRRKQSANEDTFKRVCRFLSKPKVVGRSEYTRVLEQWNPENNDGRLFVGFYDEVTEAPQNLLRRLFGFLGVDDTQVPSKAELTGRINESTERTIPPEIYAVLAKRHMPMLRELEARFGKYPGKWREDAERACS